jgi:putative tryptophan/tyrosine transport system substrate-binding protein
MNRRVFLSAVTSGLLAAPLAVEAQQAGKVHRIGFFGTFPLGPQNSNPHWNAFLEGLRDHGYVEGKNLEIVERYTGGQPERLPIIATELVASGVSVIVAHGPGPAKAAKEATEIIPIVFVGSSDPVGFGLVASLARPGGNVTGLARTEWEGFQAKQLQVIKEALPTASRVAILINPSTRMHALILPQEQEAQLGWA